MKFLYIVSFLFFNVSLFSQTDINFTNGKIKKFDISDFNIKIIPLETNDACLIGQPQTIITHNNKWYIVDRISKSILIFNYNGTYYQTFNKQGDEPGKYSNIRYFTINPYNNNIEIADNYTNTIYIYSNNGNFISQKRLSFPFISFLHLSPKEIIFNKQYQIDSKVSYNLVLTDNYYRVIKRFSKIKEIPPSALSFSSKFELKSINHKIWWLKTYDQNLYLVTKNGIQSKVKIDFGKMWPEHSFAFNHNLTDFNYIYHTFKNKYLYFFDFFPFNDYYLAKYTYQSKPYISVYDKNTKKAIIYDCSNMPKNFNNIKGYTNDSVIVFINPMDMGSLKVYLTKSQKKLITSYEDEPNPWIVILKYKTQK